MRREEKQVDNDQMEVENEEPKIKRGSLRMADLPSQRINCTCARSKCIKKYCSCFEAGLKCGLGCRC